MENADGTKALIEDKKDKILVLSKHNRELLEKVRVHFPCETRAEGIQSFPERKQQRKPKIQDFVSV